MDEMKFRQALEDTGIAWDQTENVVLLAYRYLMTDLEERIDRGNNVLYEVQYLAVQGRDATQHLGEFIEDLQILCKSMDDELRYVVKTYIDRYAEDTEIVRKSFADILDHVEGEL